MAAETEGGAGTCRSSTEIWQQNCLGGVDFLAAYAAWIPLRSGHPNLSGMVWLTSWAALWTIFICPL